MKRVAGFRRAALCLAALICGGGYLHAADLSPRLIFIGGRSYLPDREIISPDNTFSSVGFKNRFQAGISAGVHVAAFLALEAGFRTGQYELRAHQSNGSSMVASVDFAVQQFYINAVYNTHYSDGGLRLFATGGIGVRRSTHPASSGNAVIQVPSGSEIASSFNFGGGLEARASRRLSLVAEVRDFVGAVPQFVPSFPRRGLLHDVHVSAGLMVHLR